MSLLASLLLLHLLPGPRPVALPADSIGQEMRGGQRFVRHRVAAGEAPYGIAKRYHLTVEQLMAANPQVKNGLGIGQVVLVPRPTAGAKVAATAPATTPAAPDTPASAAADLPARHTVVKGETLFGIARQYKVPAATLAQLNNLAPGAGVRIGQELLLRPAQGGSMPPPQTTPTPVANPAAAATRPATTTPATASPAATREAVVATVTPAPDKDKEKEKPAGRDPEPDRTSELMGRKTEDGIAALIDNNATDKYLALHKTAAVGTIMQVKNMMNGQSVYVRVIGQLPDTGENQNVLVRLSPRAVAKLGTADAKFRVETSYIP